MIEVTCKRCLYHWVYKGLRTYYATCPNCKTAVKLPTIETTNKKG